ncbi:MAG: hypothetical protein GY898_22190 [Proteobacteria bacterium]|nr:hypothetical protein [Pseudomonadota bacterium]
MKRALLLLSGLAIFAGCPEPEPEPGPPGPLALEITSPPDGTITSADTVLVEGTWSGGGDPQITVAGVAADLGEGTFSATVPRSAVTWTDSPLWPLLAEGTDAEGAWVRGRVTAIAGDATDTGRTISEGVVARVTQPGLEQLGPFLEDFIEGIDLGAAIGGPDPVFTLLGADLYVDDAGFGEADLTLTATVVGLDYVLVAHDVWADVTVDFGFLGSTDGTVLAEQLIVTGVLTLSADAGDLTATPSGTSVEVVNPSTGTLSDPAGFLDDIINFLFSDTLGAQVEEALVSGLEGTLEGALRELSFGEMTVANEFVLATHDDDGLNLNIASSVSTVGERPAQRRTTSELRPMPSGTTADSGASYGGGAWLDDDLLNELGATMIAGGYLDQELRGEVGGFSLDSTTLGVFVTPLGELRPDLPLGILTSGVVAPVATAGGLPDEAAQYHLGGLVLTIVGDEDADGTEEELLVAAADAIVGLGMEADTLDTAVDELSITILRTSLSDVDIEGTETQLAAIFTIAVRQALDQLLGTGLIPFEGLGVEPVEAGAGGPDGDRAAVFLDFTSL